MESDTGDLAPKIDLTRLEDFDPSKEPVASPDAGLDFDMTRVGPDLTRPPPDTEALLEAMRAPSSQPPPPPPSPILGISIPPVEPTLLSEAPPPDDPQDSAGSHNALDEVRRFSEQVSVAKELVPAAFPFSVAIDGELQPEEKERLMDLLN